MSNNTTNTLTADQKADAAEADYHAENAALAAAKAAPIGTKHAAASLAAARSYKRNLGGTLEDHRTKAGWAAEWALSEL